MDGEVASLTPPVWLITFQFRSIQCSWIVFFNFIEPPGFYKEMLVLELKGREKQRWGDLTHKNRPISSRIQIWMGRAKHLLFQEPC